jgi:hypothetical protein
MNSADSALIQEMHALESSLLHSDYSAQPALLERLLHRNFVEINARGSETSRAQVLQWLLQKSTEERWEFSQLKVVELAPETRLVTYHARQIIPARPESKGSLHSSLWCLHTEAQCWQLRFHQASKCV